MLYKLLYQFLLLTYTSCKTVLGLHKTHRGGLERQRGSCGDRLGLLERRYHYRERRKDDSLLGYSWKEGTWSLNWERRSSQDLPQWLPKNHPTSHKPCLTCPSSPLILILQVWEGPSMSSILHRLPFCQALYPTFAPTGIPPRLSATFCSHLWCFPPDSPKYTVNSNNFYCGLSVKSPFSNKTSQNPNNNKTARDKM